MLKDKSSKIILFFYSSVAVLLAVILLKSYLKTDPGLFKEPAPQDIIVEEANAFGIFTSSLSEKKERVKKNETLSEILDDYYLNEFDISEIAELSREIFDVRKIKPGREYYMYISEDSLQSLKYFVYQIDPVNYVVYDFNDSINIYSGSKEVEIREASRSAEITSSLYESLIENSASPELAVRLSQIYAWQIDFYRIQSGDRFKVLYEEKFVDGKPVGIGKILGAQFIHNGEEFLAVPFRQDEVEQYFDSDGNSLRKAFLKAPLEFSRISSRYNKKRFHPVLKRTKAHLGTDYAAPHGTPIRSVGDGVVITAGYSRGNGNYVKIKHNSVYTTQYLHMSRFAKGIKSGVRIQQGDVIGYVGSTGLATGPHLCYRFWKNGVQVDPFKEKIPPSHPVKPELKADFDSVKTEVINKLITIPFKKSADNKLPV